MYHHDYDSILYGEDGDNPLKPTLKRCLRDCQEDDCRMKVEVRVQPLGTSSSKQEHQFVVDGDPELGDVVIANLKERLEAAPGEGFEGRIRINFYQNGNTTIKYGSYTRQMRQSPADNSYNNQNNSANPMMNMMNMMGGQPQHNQQPNQESSFGEEFGGLDGSDFNNNEESNPFEENTEKESSSNNFDPKQMQQMMQLMQMMGGGANGGPVDNKMAMDWLSHTMSFLFRSLSLQMSMFERSTKLVEIYAMRFGLPQPLERPNPEKIIREVPMEMDFPQYQLPPEEEEKGGFSLLPQLLNAAAAFAGNPGAASLLQTAAGLAQGSGNKPKAPPRQQIPKPPTQKRAQNRSKQQKEPPQNRYIKQSPPAPKKPVDGAEEFEWEEDQTDQKSEFAFGLDGSHQRIDPFPHNQGPTNQDNEWSGAPNEEEESFEEEFEGHDQMDDQVPEGFPDLTGMSGEQMKQTVIDWVEADPDTRKQQIMQMLPELSSIIM